MSEWIGLLMVWLGGALCGTVYTAIWVAHRARKQRRDEGYYTKADVDAAWRRIRRYNFAPPASARAETLGGSVADESPVPKADAHD